MEIKERQKIFNQRYRAKKRLIRYKGENYSTREGFTREKDLEILCLTLDEARDKFNLPNFEGQNQEKKDNPEPSKENEHQDSKEIKTTPELFVEEKEEKEPKTNCCDDADNWYWLDMNNEREREAIKLGYREVCSKCYNLK